MHNYMYNFIYGFVHNTCNTNIQIIIGKIYKKCNSRSRLVCRYFQHIFTNCHISNTTHVSINKQLKRFQNCFAVLSQL